jgi:hypothetical protein
LTGRTLTGADVEVWIVCCEGLVCAACSGRVSDGQCPTCRAYRDEHHVAGVNWSVLTVPLLATVLGLLLLLALHVRLG